MNTLVTTITHIRWLIFSQLLCVGWMTICTIGCIEGRSSNHELDHVVPAHWPENLADAADKIEARLACLNTAAEPQTLRELSELIEWLPQVAADTSMQEITWAPLNETCQKVKGMLRNPQQFPAADAGLRSLCGQLRELQQTLDVDLTTAPTE